MNVSKFQSFFVAFCTVALAIAFARGADNYLERNTQVIGSTDQVVLRTTESGGVHTPHVFLDGIDAVTGNFTRPADTTAYAIGDLVANSTTAGSVTPITLAVAKYIDGGGIIERIRLKRLSPSLTNASFRIHFYKAAPTCTNGDNGAWLTTESTYLGSADVTLDKAFSDGAKGIGVPTQGPGLFFTAITGTKNIYALVESRGAYTPTSGEVFTLTVEVWQN